MHVRFVLDGEIVIPVGKQLSFDELLLRIHPAASRVNALAAEHPAMLIVFDLLVNDRGASLVTASPCPSVAWRSRSLRGVISRARAPFGSPRRRRPSGR